MDEQILLLVIGQLKASLSGFLRDKIVAKSIDGKITEEDVNDAIEEFLDAKINLTLKKE